MEQNSSWDQSRSNSSSIYNTDHDNRSTDHFCWYSNEKNDILTYFITSMCLPLTPVAIYSMYTQVQNDYVAPIYVINLLISDLIQLFCMIAGLSVKKDFNSNECFILTPHYIYSFGVMASVVFRLCVTLERYLAITCQVWYQFRCTIKISIMACVGIWLISSFLALLCIVLSPILLFHLPLLIFFLIRTANCLPGVTSVPSDEKQQAVAILVVVLITCLLMFLPEVPICFKNTLLFLNYITLERYEKESDYIYSLVCTFYQFTPLTDLFLYIVMNKRAIDKLLVCLHCYRMNSVDISRSTASRVNEMEMCQNRHNTNTVI